MYEIRKISVGVNYPSKSMHFQVGSRINFGGIDFTIQSIKLNDNKYDIFISNVDYSVLWKSVSISMPVVVEYNIDFE